MKSFSRQPSRTERWLAILLSFVAMLGLAGLSSILWLYSPSRSVTGVFTGLFLVSTWLLFRAVRSAPRALSSAETSAVSWTLLGLGAAGIVAALLVPAVSIHRLMLLGSGLSLLGTGLGGVRRQRRDA